MKRAILWGAAAALVVSALALAVVAMVVHPLSRDGALDRILVIAVVGDAGGGEAAPIAFVLDSMGAATQLDALRPALVPGTSAGSARDAFPFGGGAAVASALSVQTGGDRLEWVALPVETCIDLVDEAGGVEVDLPSSLSVYTDGSLTVLPSGRRKLTGEEAIALASAIKYVSGESTRSVVAEDIGSVLSEAVVAREGGLTGLLRDGLAESSVDVGRLPVFPRK